MESLVSQLECCAVMLDKAERWEMLGKLYQLLMPIYEGARNHRAQVEAYGHLYQVLTSSIRY